VGTFVPLVSDQQGTVVREVAPAQFALPLPDHPGQVLSLSVALIRDLRRQMPAVSSEDVVPGVHRWYSDLDLDARNFWEQGWKATPAPATPTQAKLIPIVSTASTADPVALARLYMQRWPVQENIIRDCAPFRREIGYLPKAGEVESETSRTTPDPTRKLGKGH
jgi:hypothetical protein